MTGGLQRLLTAPRAGLAPAEGPEPSLVQIGEIGGEGAQGQLRILEFQSQVGLFDLQSVQAALDPRPPQAFRDRGDQALQLLFNFLKTGFERSLLGVHLAALPVDFGMNFPNELRNKVGSHAVGAQSIQDVFSRLLPNRLHMTAACAPMGPGSSADSRCQS